MKTFTKPQNLNGAELISELNAAGIAVIEINDLANGQIAFETNNETTAAEIVANHNGTIIPVDLSAKRKAILEKLGITEEEAKLLLS